MTAITPFVLTRPTPADVSAIEALVAAHGEGQVVDGLRLTTIDGAPPGGSRT